MSFDESLDAWLLWFWLGFSFTFVVLVWVHHLSVHNKTRAASGTPSLVRLSLGMRIALTFIAGVGILGAAGLWTRFGANIPWTAVSFWAGIATGFLIALRLFGHIKHWGDNSSSLSSEDR
jgi:hypothetical protein